VPRKALDTILKSKWAGTHYSTSVWQNRDAMAGILDRALMEVSSMGKLSDMTMQDVRGMVDLNKWRNQVKSKFKTEAQYQKYAANRLIRTESAYVANQTTAVAYDECGIERYEYMATLDRRTSEKCSGLDGKIFEMSEKEVGVNYPPAHPHCRSSVAPVIDGLVREGLTRSARDANGKSVYVPRDMKYQEWKAWQKDGAPADVVEWRERNAPQDQTFFGVANRDPNKVELTVSSVVKARGYDGNPTIITEDEFNRRISEGSPYMTRGYTAPSEEVAKAYKDSLDSGEWYLDCRGGSTYGQGMYTAAVPDPTKTHSIDEANKIATGYSRGGRVSVVEKMTMRPDSKIGKFEKILEEYANVLADHADTVYVPDESLREPIKDWLWKRAGRVPGKVASESRLMRILENGNINDDKAYELIQTLYSPSDAGIMATRLGYDAYDANENENGMCFRIVVNRGKLMIVR